MMVVCKNMFVSSRTSFYINACYGCIFKEFVTCIKMSKASMSSRPEVSSYLTLNNNRKMYFNISLIVNYIWLSIYV